MPLEASTPRHIASSVRIGSLLRSLAVLTGSALAMAGLAGPAASQAVENRVMFSAPAPIAAVSMNGAAAEWRAIQQNVVEVTIRGDDTGISCTNTFDFRFEGAPDGRIIANHCHGETHFAAVPGQTVDAQERHDGNEDVGFNELARGPGPATGSQQATDRGELELAPGPRQKSVEDQFKWQFSSPAGERPVLALAVPETDQVVLVATCLPETKRIKTFFLMYPDALSQGATPKLTYRVDETPPVTYDLGYEPLPFFDNPKTPALYTNSRHSLFYLLAKGQTVRFEMNGEIADTFSLSGSAREIRPFLEACHALEG
ncbi:hypothetical protein [Stappia sp. ES.058]|uniref:hypothetical protein n=1 Tax=Stappia sp. ES.058 TaxID=1881061 RepID=UPI0012FD4DBE|nr:hypothetical protein [Stappia sp. ES.058]